MKVVLAGVVEGVGEDGRGGGDQPLMVEEGSAERGVKETVGNDIIRRPRAMENFVDGKLRCVVIAHH
jgi:hypothetical protein